MGISAFSIDASTSQTNDICPLMKMGGEKCLQPVSTEQITKPASGRPLSQHYIIIVPSHHAMDIPSSSTKAAQLSTGCSFGAAGSGAEEASTMQKFSLSVSQTTAGVSEQSQ